VASSFQKLAKPSKVEPALITGTPITKIFKVLKYRTVEE
jgi:hypothetical protein